MLSVPNCPRSRREDERGWTVFGDAHRASQPGKLHTFVRKRERRCREKDVIGAFGRHHLGHAGCELRGGWGGFTSSARINHPSDFLTRCALQAQFHVLLEDPIATAFAIANGWFAGLVEPIP